MFKMLNIITSRSSSTKSRVKPVAPLILYLGCWAAFVLPAHASDDHEKAIKALKANEIVPLAHLMKKLDGRLIEAELEFEKGRYVYELEVIDGNGRLKELLFDATTGDLLKSDRKEKDD